LSKDLKKQIKDLLEEAGADEDVIGQVTRVRACPAGQEIAFGGKGGGGPKRALSAYQQFIKACMTSGEKKPLGECASAWKQDPANPKNR
jgi:hypothetical protein